MLDISTNIDPVTREIVTDVNRVAIEQKIPCMLVGAAARIMLMNHAYGAPILLATEDYDFGICVSHWEAFEKLRERLIEDGYRKTKAKHRIVSGNNILVDIIPFGAIQDHEGNISWPPDQSINMSVLGFQEALDNAENILINKNPDINVLVVSCLGFVLLKIISWKDRTSDLRGKDSRDLKYMFNNYELVPDVIDEAFVKEIPEKYDWDITLSTTHLLGMNVRKIAKVNTILFIEKMNAKVGNMHNYEILAEEMCKDINTEYDKNISLVNAFFNGFNQE